MTVVRRNVNCFPLGDPACHVTPRMSPTALPPFHCSGILDGHLDAKAVRKQPPAAGHELPPQVIRSGLHVRVA